MPVLDRHVAGLLRRARRDLKADRHADAIAALTAAVDANPKSASAHYHLARAHFFLGEIEHATRALRRAAPARRPLQSAGVPRHDCGLRSGAGPCGRLAVSPGALHGDSQAVRHDPAPPAGRVGVGAKNPQSRLRLVVLPGGNWMKPVWGLIDHHDRRRFEIHLFSDAPRSAIGHRFTSRRDRFHDISRHDNARAARLIASRRIDVLVDLNGYSPRGRLPLFVLKPAPSWRPGSTSSEPLACRVSTPSSATNG